jgi:hypothetical protein
MRVSIARSAYARSRDGGWNDGRDRAHPGWTLAGIHRRWTEGRGRAVRWFFVGWFPAQRVWSAHSNQQHRSAAHAG